MRERKVLLVNQHRNLNSIGEGLGAVYIAMEQHSANSLERMSVQKQTANNVELNSSVSLPKGHSALLTMLHPGVNLCNSKIDCFAALYGTIHMPLAPTETPAVARKHGHWV